MNSNFKISRLFSIIYFDKKKSVWIVCVLVLYSSTIRVYINKFLKQSVKPILRYRVRKTQFSNTIKTETLLNCCIFPTAPNIEITLPARSTNVKESIYIYILSAHDSPKCPLIYLHGKTIDVPTFASSPGSTSLFMHKVSYLRRWCK